MRWRYLILGVMCCVPVGTAIQVWPPRPVFTIPGGRQYLGDDATKSHLLFIREDKEKSLSIIERFDATSGKLASEVSVKFPKFTDVRVPDDRFVLSKDSSLVRFHSHEFNQTAFFDTNTGTLRLLAGMDVTQRDEISPNGRYYARTDNIPNFLVMQDTLSGATLFKLQSPRLEKCHDVIVSFSPDGSKVLLQCLNDDSPAPTLYLLNCENGKEEGQFQLPADHTLLEWRQGELRSIGSAPETAVCQLQNLSSVTPAFIYRHRFDGMVLEASTYDPLLDAALCDVRTPRIYDCEEFVCQFERFEIERRPQWGDLIMTFAQRINLLMDTSKIPVFRGVFRIIDRATHSARFELQIEASQQYAPALKGKCVVISNDHHNPFKFAIPSSFEIYRTDPWPRWLWTAMGVVGVMLPFVWFARRRHSVVMRRASDGRGQVVSVAGASG